MLALFFAFAGAPALAQAPPQNDAPGAPPILSHPAPPPLENSSSLPPAADPAAPAMRVDAARYPEVGRLGEAAYCNPFFGFRLPLPAEMKMRRLHLPVQPAGRHVLLALRYSRLDRPAEFFISAFPDATPQAAKLAAAVHRQELSKVAPSSPELREVSLAGHSVQRLRAALNARDGNELDFYFETRGWVVRLEIHTLDREMEDALAAQVAKLSFFADASDAADAGCAEAPLYYGPGLPTSLVDERIAQHPGSTVPAGEFRDGVFSAPFLGLRVTLPARWQTLSEAERERLPELLAEPEKNRRHDLLRACSRVLFGAYDPLVEPVSGVHPALAVSAMPLGCVPGLVPPAPTAQPEVLYDFGHALLDSMGLGAIGEWKMRPERGAYSLAGAMPYRVPGEPLSRRLTLRVSAIPRGDSLLLIYSVTTSPSGQRALNEHISLAAPPSKAKE